MATKRKLRVTEQETLASLKNDSTLYKVFAVDENGEPVEQELRSFEELPAGELIEYEVTRYDHAEYGTSFTLKPPKQNLGKRTAALERSLAELTTRVEALESGVGGAAAAEPDEDDVPF